MAGVPGFTGWLGVVLQSPDPRGLARFYERLLGWGIATDEPTWVTMQMHDGDGRPLPANLAFQLDEAYEPPTWPSSPGEQQMQLHLDVEVTDVATATQSALDLGARLHEHQPQDDVRVLLDPDGHVLCLYANG
ncbi:glyoxalase [Marmoricola endophyticus]|uniref:Glyoxalase n=1 Tax=Marmoricola endophyticus TaxID=2040280 RepID=A0A917F206_9ACTN|nr:VOC family protein [Marmoricola endophyticus]GGF36946.1 glyoxalase [Marmoricola endophyticus]